MKSKFLFLMSGIFLVFLLSSVSAVVVYGDWQDESQSITITQGDSVKFSVDFFSLTPPMTVNVKFFDSNDKLIYTFEDNRVVSGSDYVTFAKTYTITESIYKTTGNFEVILTGSDPFPSSDTHVLTLNVKEKEVPEPPKNNPPKITSQPATMVNEKTPYTYDVEATDADNDVLTYSLTQKPSWLSINASNGLITGIAPSVDADKIYIVTVDVSDGKGGSDTQSYQITVKNIPEPPKNNPPKITSTPITMVNEKTLYTYDVEATDADNDPLAFSLTEAPNFLSIDSSTGIISGTAPEVSADTMFNVTVRVADPKGGTDTQSYVLTVKNKKEQPKNNPPVITSQPVTMVNEKKLYNYQVTATDPDGDVLTFSLLQSPDFLKINSTTGLISGTAPEVLKDTEFAVKLQVSDGKGGTATQSYVLTVKNVKDDNGDNGNDKDRSGRGSIGVREIPADPYDTANYFNQFNPAPLVLDEETTNATESESNRTALGLLFFALLFLILLVLILIIIYLMRM